MVRIITLDDVKNLIRKMTLEKFFSQLIERLELTFSRWDEFEKIPRVASTVEKGILELMPFWGKDYYSVKYVNGHPHNPKDNKQAIVGIGILADVATGYPLMISEMTLLTALRTAATAALASKYLAKLNSRTFAIIGTGAQSEFQVIAHKILFDIQTINYFDIDPNAMGKFAKNLLPYGFDLQQKENAESSVKNADIITTLTAAGKQSKILKEEILKEEWIKPGMSINVIGGDCPDKMELDPKILEQSKIVIEFLEQSKSKEEGEIQDYNSINIYAELWELSQGKKLGRTSDDEIFVFDSMGFALEDYVILRLVYSLAEDFHVGHMLDMVPESRNPNDLFGLLS